MSKNVDNSMEDMTLEEKKDSVLACLSLLSNLLSSTDLYMGYDNDSDSLIFVDKKKFNKHKISDGFKVPLGSISRLTEREE
ncbi:MAG: hypothetical protein ACLTDM_11255 [Clostridium butyricum]